MNETTFTIGDESSAIFIITYYSDDNKIELERESVVVINAATFIVRKTNKSKK